jgi:hypothetical protein
MALAKKIDCLQTRGVLVFSHGLFVIIDLFRVFPSIHHFNV